MFNWLKSSPDAMARFSLQRDVKGAAMLIWFALIPVGMLVLYPLVRTECPFGTEWVAARSHPGAGAYGAWAIFAFPVSWLLALRLVPRYANTDTLEQRTALTDYGPGRLRWLRHTLGVLAVAGLCITIATLRTGVCAEPTGLRARGSLIVPFSRLNWALLAALDNDCGASGPAYNPLGGSTATLHDGSEAPIPPAGTASPFWHALAAHFAPTALRHPGRLTRCLESVSVPDSARKSTRQ